MAKKRGKPTRHGKSKRRDLPDPSLPVYQLKVTLEHVQPAVWRRALTHDCTLDELHHILQDVMGWDDAHMHAFEVGDEQYAYHPDADTGDFADSRAIRLSDVLRSRSDCFVYEYDFGDSWRHLIVIEKTLAAEPGVLYPRCAAGERACPPEDCGGPWGYQEMLEQIAGGGEPDEELLEWLGDDFDPGLFDLDGVNRLLEELRSTLGDQPADHLPQPSFAEGDLVRVKPGVVHRRYPDLPLGGWEGTVERVAWLVPVGYTIDWSVRTFEAAHPIYHKRCQRDGLLATEYEAVEGELEPAADEDPLAMAPPTEIVTRPLSPDDSDDRVRAIFGLTSDDPLPRADEAAIGRYFEFLRDRVVFPFQAYCSPSAGEGLEPNAEVTVVGWADPPVAGEEGVRCRVRAEHGHVVTLLACLEVIDEGPARQLVGDFNDWQFERHPFESDEGDAHDEYDEEGRDDEDDFDDDDFDEDDFDDEEEEEEFDDDEAGPAPQYPLGTVAFYGPDDRRTTKVVAGVFLHDGAEPILKRWMASDVMRSRKVGREMKQFFDEHHVQSMAMTDGNLGCPHEEGEDFPVGGDCPFCPFWKGKQGSGAREESPEEE